MLRRDPSEDGNRGAGRYSLGDPAVSSRQGSLNYQFLGGSNLMQMYGRFEGYPLN